MTVLFPQMFSTTVGESKCLYAIPEMLYFYNLKNPKIFDALNQILWDAREECFKPQETGNVLETSAQIESLDKIASLQLVQN
jgi:hypothetical protein